MSSTKKVQFNLLIPEQYRDMLRKMAAEEIYRNPEKVISASQIGARIICDFLRNMEDEGERSCKI